MTAAHCESVHDLDDNAIVLTEKKGQKGQIILSGDHQKKNNSLNAKIFAVGYEWMGDDFAILEVKTSKDIPILEFSTDEVEVGQLVLNISFPARKGDNTYLGKIVKTDLPYKLANPYYKGSFLVAFENLKVDPGGSSGSLVLDLSSNKVIGILVAKDNYMGGIAAVIIPISRFLEFEKQIEAGTYPYKTVHIEEVLKQEKNKKKRESNNEAK